MASSKSLSPEERILKSALREFSKYGYFGARVARITRAAKVNARMLFYYFENKEKLFAAVLDSVWKKGALVQEAPTDPVESIIFWSEFYRKNPEWTRMVLWEGLQLGKEDIENEAERRKIWQLSVEIMRSHTGPGGWPEFLDTPHYLLSHLSIVLAPLSLPHLARLITGKDPSSPEFIAERESFLRDFATFLAMRRQPPEKKVRVVAKKRTHQSKLKLDKPLSLA